MDRPASAARPTPIAEAPCVVKADEARGGKRRLRLPHPGRGRRRRSPRPRLGGGIVIEELLEGREVSLFALCDGTRAFPLGAAQDYKRADDGDAGPNTGGMGAYSPVAGWTPPELVERIHQPVVDELARRGTPFVGVPLRRADADRARALACSSSTPASATPRPRCCIPRLEGDLLEALAAAAARRPASRRRALEATDAAVTVVAHRARLPRAKRLLRRARSRASTAAEAVGALVFHGGTAMRRRRRS